MTAIHQARWLVETVGVRTWDDLAVLRVAGDDARTWLNGQVTNDVREMKRGDAVYALVIHVRGKVLADVWVLDRGEDQVLLVPRAALAPVVEAFEKYIIMEDVEVAELAHLAVLGAYGPKAKEVIESWGRQDFGDEQAPDAHAIFPCDRLGTSGFEVLVMRSRLGEVAEAMAAKARMLGGGEVSDEGWELARVRLGIPRFGRDFGPENYPQEAGLKARAVSFTKGCYVGQEVVCTLENRGQLVNKLVVLEAGAAPPPAGTEIQGPDGSPLGKITTALVDPVTGHALALGYVKRASATPGTEVRVADAPLTIREVVGGP